MRRNFWHRGLGITILILAEGCAREPSTLSPAATADPARYQRAVGEMETMHRRNREAEARFFRALAANRVPADQDSHRAAE